MSAHYNTPLSPALALKETALSSRLHWMSSKRVPTVQGDSGGHIPWFGWRRLLKFLPLIQLDSQFCQIPICPCRKGRQWNDQNQSTRPKYVTTSVTLNIAPAPLHCPCDGRLLLLHRQKKGNEIPSELVQVSVPWICQSIKELWKSDKWHHRFSKSIMPLQFKGCHTGLVAQKLSAQTLAMPPPIQSTRWP